MTLHTGIKRPFAGPIHDRCAALGLPTWRSDSAGKVIAPPAHGPPIGLWLRSGAVTRLVNGIAHEWAAEDEAEVRQAFPGCWLIPVQVVERRERAGHLIAMALSPEALLDEWFAAGCASAQLDQRAMRAAMAPMARHSEASARSLKQTLTWMLDDARQRAQDTETIEGFTRQLTDGFETIDLLYSLGRSMSSLSRPGAFTHLVCERLLASMNFGWVGAWLDADPKCARLTGEKFVVKGVSSTPEQLIERRMQSFASEIPSDTRPRIMNELDGAPLPGCSQILVQPIVRGKRILGALLCGDKSGDDPQVSSYDMHLLEAAGGYVAAFLDNALLYADHQAMFMGTLRAMTASIDAKDRYTRGHSERVAHLARQLARALGLGEDAGERLHICGLVHDVGKIGVPEGVLGKRGKLTDDEFGHIKKHPEIGYNILKDIPLLEDILPGVLYHHERIDGRGYPHGLKGMNIPLFARVVALADTFDAMSSTRSYRSALPREKVLDEMRRCAGSQLDSEMVPHFVRMDFTEYDELVRRHAADDPSASPEAPSAAAA
ncbi:MAG: HD-GYP domain-containing protein [Phycisphaerales bacterium]